MLVERVAGHMAAERTVRLPIHACGHAAPFAGVVVVVPAPFAGHRSAGAAIGRRRARAIGVVPVQGAAIFLLRHRNLTAPDAGRTQKRELAVTPEALAPFQLAFAHRRAAAITAPHEVGAALGRGGQQPIGPGKAGGGDQVGHAPDRAAVVFRQQRLHHIDAVHEVRRQHIHQRLAAADVVAGEGKAVDQHAVVVAVEAAHRHIARFALVLHRAHAGDPAQRIAHIEVRQLPDAVGGDRIHDGGRRLLGGDGARVLRLERVAHLHRIHGQRVGSAGHVGSGGLPGKPSDQGQPQRQR